MANFEVLVDDKAFSRLGVKPAFNEALYGELLDEFVPGDQSVDVCLSPHITWGQGFLGKIVQAAGRREDYIQAGVYGENRVKVNCLEDVGATNKTLLHETKHYIDDVSGEIDNGRTRSKYQKRAIVGAALAGLITGLELNEPIIAVATALPAAPLLYGVYWKSPCEVAARRFSASPEIVEAYGGVISYV